MTKSQRINNLTLIGAPTDIGAGKRGGSMGPEAIRVAGLEQALNNLGIAVIDKGNLIGPNNPNAGPVDGYRHLDETVHWCQEVREAFYHALSSDELPILLGGDHSLAIGSIAGVAQHCHEVGKKLNILWLDAHADFNSNRTTPSGNIHGMPLAALFGLCHPKLTGILHERPHAHINNAVQIGIRSVDTLEKEQLNQYPVHVFDMRMVDEHSMKVVMEKALEMVCDEDAHLHVSFDVDFLDPEIAPGVATTVRGGPTYREAQLCMEMIHDSGLLNSLDIVELNPAFDNQNQTAQLTVELIESLFGKRTLARNPVH